jgi:excisionase family DNA binding protein
MKKLTDEAAGTTAVARVMYRVEEVARMLGVSTKSVRRAIQRGKIKENRTFRVILIPAAEVTRFANA